MRKSAIIVLLTAAIGFFAFRKKEPYTLKTPPNWPPPAYTFSNNPLTANKIALGRMLFYDPVLSADSTISCASCHSPFNAFAHTDHDLSHGIHGRIGKRNAPALMNLAWSTSFMWDGAVNHLDVLSLAPISDSLEMNENIGHIAAKLQANKQYVKLFKHAYGNSDITSEHILKSLSQFLITLVSAESKYDSVKLGTAQFTESEAKGYVLFTQHCAACHTEPLFTNHQFANNGLYPDRYLNDAGRRKVTGDPTDLLHFKVPTLRNIAYTAPYMHDGRFKNLSQVLNHYIRGLQQTPLLSDALRKGIYLSPTEKADLIAFLYTLSDKKFVTNPEYAFPKIKSGA